MIAKGVQSQLDTKPRVPIVFEPGEKHWKMQPELSDSEISEEEVGKFEQVARRNFVARRGRNNRLLLKPILQNVFKEDSDVGEQEQKNPRNPG